MDVVFEGARGFYKYTFVSQEASEWLCKSQFMCRWAGQRERPGHSSCRAAGQRERPRTTSTQPLSLQVMDITWDDESASGAE